LGFGYSLPRFQVSSCGLLHGASITLTNDVVYAERVNADETAASWILWG